MRLNVGVSYLAVQAADQIIVSETEEYDFDEKRIVFRVLDKPEKVYAEDDINREEIDIPDHLKGDDWYFVKDLIDDTNRWLNTSAYEISELNKNPADIKGWGTILTGKQIMIIADIAGLVVDESKSFNQEDKEAFLETEFTIKNDVKVSSNGKDYYRGKVVHLTEYPEEGYLPLDAVE